jgi:hypothetical protein
VWSRILAFGVIGPYLFEDETGNAVGVTSGLENRIISRNRDIFWPDDLSACDFFSWGCF